MNIPQKFLSNNGLSEAKKSFYENVANRYSKISHDPKKKSSHDYSNFNKRVLNWFFNQNEDTRMLLCSVENKKYTNTIYDAYSYILKHPNGVKFCFSEEDNREDEKYKLNATTSDYNKYFGQNNYKNNEYNTEYLLNTNSYKDNSLKETKNTDEEFLNNIIFYQSESSIEDLDNYSSYFTLNKDFLKNEEIFKHCCNSLSYNNFLSEPIILKKDVQNKTISSFELPYWITNERKQLKQNINIGDEDYFNDINDENNGNYFSLSQYCLALIEQVLCVRYMIYNQNKNMNDIISSIYLNDLLEKKNLMLDFLNSLDFNAEKFNEKFEVPDINTKLFYDQKIDEFIKEKNLNINKIFDENEKFNYSEFYNEEKSKIKIFESEDMFQCLCNIYDNDKEKINKELINKITFFHIAKLYTYEDFFNRILFEKMHEEYSKKICEDLIMGDIKKGKKKKRRKKKNNNNNENKINVDEIKENIENQRKLIYDFVKNLIFEKLNKRLNECYEKEKNNKNKKVKNNKKEKEFYLYQSITKKNNKKGINNKNNNNNNNSNKKKENNKYTAKENEVGLNEIKINIDSNANNINDNNVVSRECKKEYKEDIINSNINYQNEIKDNNSNLLKHNSISVNNIEIQSHINSFTLTSSTNSSTSSDSLNYKLKSNSSNKNINLYQNEKYDNNNLFVLHQNPMIMSYQKFYKLSQDVLNFYTDIESLLVILREIKLEIKTHLENIIKKVYDDAKIEIYGSTLYKLDIETSDLDLSISTKKENNLQDLVDYLDGINQDKKYINIYFISTASIPIIKIEVDFLKLNIEKINKLNQKLINNEYYKLCLKNNYCKDFNIIKVDISLNSINYKQLNFINQGIKQFPQITYLIKILKKLLIYKHMNNSYKGGMSSYCLFLIIYSYLKMYSPFYTNNSIENSYGSLLIGFLFHYVMYIDFKYTMINPLLDNPFNILSYPVETIPTIIEPTTLKNAGKNIYRIYDVLKTLSEIYRDIYIILKRDYNDTDENYIYELFKNYIQNDN